MPVWISNCRNTSLPCSDLSTKYAQNNRSDTKRRTVLYTNRVNWLPDFFQPTKPNHKPSLPHSLGGPRLGLRGHGSGPPLPLDLHHCLHRGDVRHFVRGAIFVRRHEADWHDTLFCRAATVLASWQWGYINAIIHGHWTNYLCRWRQAHEIVCTNLSMNMSFVEHRQLDIW